MDPLCGFGPFPLGIGFPICGMNSWAFEELNKMGEGQLSNDIQNMSWLQTCLIPSIIAIVAQPQSFFLWRYFSHNWSFLHSCIQCSLWASLMGQQAKNQPAMQETQEMWVQSQGWEDPLEEKNGNLLSILAWRIPWIEEPGGLWYKGSQRVRHNWATKHTLQSMLHPAARLLILKWDTGNFPGGPVVKSLPCNAGNASSIPDSGTKIPHTEE